MAKEFKDFDKKYKHLAGTAYNTLRRVQGAPDLTMITCVPKHILDDVKKSLSGWSCDAAAIHYAVYVSDGAERWQQFRVSLKGCNTVEKIACLIDWYNWNLLPGAGGYLTVAEYRDQLIRFNNYIGALQRGGWLDAEGKIIKW